MAGTDLATMILLVLFSTPTMIRSTDSNISLLRWENKWMRNFLPIQMGIAKILPGTLFGKAPLSFTMTDGRLKFFCLFRPFASVKKINRIGDLISHEGVK